MTKWGMSTILLAFLATKWGIQFIFWSKKGPNREYKPFLLTSCDMLPVPIELGVLSVPTLQAEERPDMFDPRFESSSLPLAGES